MIPWRRQYAVTGTFSEFTYSFALVNELVMVGNPPVVSVPVFPSLIQEGRAMGGTMWRWIARVGHFFCSSNSRSTSGDVARENFGRRRVSFGVRSIVWAFVRDDPRASMNSFAKPSEFPPINDEDEHWISFREARGGPIAFYSSEGTKIELDERPILDRLLEDLKRAEEVPLRETLTNLASWLTHAAGVDGRLEREDVAAQGPEAALARVALLSHTVLNSTLCILQPRSERRENS